MIISDIRKKLYGITQTLFTETFCRKYEMISNQIPNDHIIAATVKQHSDDVDAYVFLAAAHIHSPKDLDRLSKIANPLVVFSLYSRYYLISNSFMDADQNKQQPFSNDDSVFIRDVLINYWRSSEAGLSK